MPERFQEYRNGWQEKHPDWQFHLWTDDNLPPMINQAIYDQVESYAEKSDVLRMELLYRYGGLYVDTDVECLKNVEPLLEGESCVLPRMTDRALCSAFMACEPGDPYFETCIHELPAHVAAKPHASAPYKTGPSFMSRFLKSFPHLKILEPHLVYPYEPRTRNAKRLWTQQGAAAFPDSYAAHHWVGSWVKRKKSIPPLFEVGKVDIQTEKVVIVGRGPSLAGFDFQQLAALPESVIVICVNQSIEQSPRADVWFTLDPNTPLQKLMRVQRPGTRYFAAVPNDFGRETAKRPSHRHGLPENVTYLRRIDGPGPERSQDGLSHSKDAINSGNSGFGALQLAYLMGAKKIVLLGFDGADTARKTGGHFDSSKKSAYLGHLPQLFNSTAMALDAEGVEVRNSNPESKITCFPRSTPQEALAWLSQEEAPNVLLLNNTSNGRHHGSDAVMQVLRQLLADAGLRIARSRHCGYTDRTSDLEIQALFKDIDLVVVNGEGSIHHDNRRARGLARIGALAAEAGVKSALINATLDCNSPATLVQLEQFDYIAVRDSQSQQALAQVGVEAELCPNLVFYNDHADLPAGTGVRVGDSVLSDISYKLQALAQQRDWTYRSCLYPRNDGRVDYYASHDAMVTGRFQDVCFCLNHHIPFLAVKSNSNKIAALLNDVFGNTQRLLPVEALGTLTEVPPFTDAELKAIDTYKKSAVEKFNHLRTRLQQLI